jgi:hypothetical protein
MNPAHTRVLLAGLLVSLLAMTTDTHAVFAQGLPAQVPPLPGLADLLNDSTGWFGKMFNDALVTVAQNALNATVAFMSALMGNGSVITQTPPSLSYDNAAVKNLSDRMVLLSDIGLAAVAAWGGLNLMIGPHIRAPYHGALELVPRVLLCGIMIHTSLAWGHFVIDMNNALCQAIGGGVIPGWTDAQQQVPDGGALLLNLIAMAVYLVMSLLLMGQMLMRLALVDVLLVMAPLALLCWVLPQTYDWARLWFSTFFGTVFVQSIQVLVLRLGTDMTQSLPTLLKQIGSNGLDGAQGWLMTLLLGIAVLQLTRNIPRLMPGFPGGMGSAPNELAAVQRIRNFLNPGSTRKARK